MKFSEFIWDFDGTLFDTYPIMVRALQEALRESGIREDQKALYLLMKQTVNEAIEFYQGRYQLGEKLLARYLEIRQSYSLEEQPPFPGARDICQHIIQQGGRCFIISHRDEASLISLLEYYNMRQFFTEIVTNDYQFKRKPNPESYHYLLEKYKLLIESSIAIGDRPLDILAAQASGIKAAYFCPGEDSWCDYADYHIHSLQEILFL